MLGLALSLIKSSGALTGPPPVITSSNAVNVNESTNVVLALTADNGPVTWSITGGVDSDKFTILTGTLRFISAPSYENPTDSGENNVYVVQVTATNAFGTDSMTINVTVVDVVETNEGSWTVIAADTAPAAGQMSLYAASATTTLPGNGQNNGNNWNIRISKTTRGGITCPNFLTLAPQGRILTFTNLTTDQEITFVVYSVSSVADAYYIYFDPTTLVTLYPGQSDISCTAGDVFRIVIVAHQITTISYGATAGTWSLDNTGPTFDYNVTYNGIETDARTFFGLGSTDLAVISPNLGAPSYAHIFVFKSSGYSFDTVTDTLTLSASVSGTSINTNVQGTSGIAKTITLGSAGNHPNSVTVDNLEAILSADFDEYGIVSGTTQNGGYNHVGNGVFVKDTPGLEPDFSVISGSGGIVSQNSGTDPAPEETSLVLAAQTPNGGLVTLNSVADVNWNDAGANVEASLFDNMARVVVVTGAGTSGDPFIITDQVSEEKDDFVITNNTLTYDADPSLTVTTV